MEFEKEKDRQKLVKLTKKCCKDQECLCSHKTECRDRNGLGGGAYVNRTWFAYYQQKQDDKEDLRQVTVPYEDQEGTYPESLQNVVGFTKSFMHDTFGELTNIGPTLGGLPNYKKFVKLLVEGDVVAANKDIIFAAENTSKLVNPFSGYATNLYGSTVLSNVNVPPPRTFGNGHAAEMVELYTQNLVLDVPFIDYNTNTKIADVVDILNIPQVRFNLPYDPYNGGPATPQNIFRGQYVNNEVGPYISQFFWLNVLSGNKPVVQRYNVDRRLSQLDGTQDYAIGWAFTRGQGASLLNGSTNEDAGNLIPTAPAPSIVDDTQLRFIYSGRSLANWVAVDPLFQGGYNTALILNAMGVPFNPTLPQFDTFSGQNTTNSAPAAQANLAIFSNLANTYAFYWKWLQYRRMRPEAAGVYTHNELSGDRNYDWPNWYSNLAGPLSNLWSLVEADNIALFNSYPDANKANVNPDPTQVPQYTLHVQNRSGAPAHPAFPAGHAAIVGAWSALLKAFYKTDTPLCEVPGLIAPDDGVLNPTIFPIARLNPADLANVEQGKAYYVEANNNGTELLVKEITDKTWTVEDEINKMAFNIGIGRDWLGVHYRSDSVEGALVGEANSIRMTQDMLAGWFEDKLGEDCSYDPAKVRITKFDGTEAIIRPTPCIKPKCPKKKHRRRHSDCGCDDKPHHDRKPKHNCGCDLKLAHKSAPRHKLAHKHFHKRVHRHAH